jgi:adenine phosphoribosyltransferase
MLPHPLTQERTMNPLIQKLIEQIIIKKAFINDYPKPGVTFLAIDRLFNDPAVRAILSRAVIASVDPKSFDAVAGIASRGFMFSGMIVNQFADKGEHFVQKVKTKGDSRYVQIDTTTEYSSDALQVLKDTIQKGQKYLLTDDLIATGGSVMTAIKLIRQCGGVVDTVFVMTELTDFNARELLKKEGVELVSLLKFTEQDLQQLLEMQNTREEHSASAITYQLTHHTSSPTEEIEDQHFEMNRLIDLKAEKLSTKHAKKGVFFAPSKAVLNSKPINFYNHGCPVDQWNIDPEKVARNSFKVFATGDAFSVMSPDIELSGANIIIHVGLDHAHYSPLVLIQEALQLCRCAYEHGARSVTIALPDQFHPVVHADDFNTLLLNLFKASGANKVYYYDKHYTGKLDETNQDATIALTVASKADADQYQIDRKELSAFLQQPKDTESDFDHQIMHFIRSRNFKKSWDKFSTAKADTLILTGENTLAEINVPEIKVQPHVVLCCAANKPLAEKIAASLRMRGEMVRLYAVEGEGKEAKIPDEAAVCGAVVTIVQSTRPNPEHMEETREYQNNGSSAYFFEAVMIAKQAQLRGAETVNLINPYQFNARSDKAENNFKGRTGAYVQQNGMLLAAAGVNQVITAECHDNHTMSGSYTGKQIKGSAVSALSIISSRLANEWMNDPEHPLQGQLRLVTPDAGAAKRTKELTELLQNIMGNKLSQTRVLGEKQRDSHKDDSALISSLNSGTAGINPQDKFLITDDETATGNTLCQAVVGLVKEGARDISVVVVHNNMPLDWLVRQLCLARFFYLGVNDLHFSDTNEMGVLARSYDDLITGYSQRAQLPANEVEAQVAAWFKKNISTNFADKTDDHINEEFIRFKSQFNVLESKVRVHTLSHEFADKVTTKPYMVNPYAFEYKVSEFVRKIKETKARSIVAFAGASLPAASAAAVELGLPLHVIPQAVAGSGKQKLRLPEQSFALIGTPSEWTLKSLVETLPAYAPDQDGDFIIVERSVEAHKDTAFNANRIGSLTAVEELYNALKCNPGLKDRPIKLLGIGEEGQVLAGQLAHLLNKNGNMIGLAAVDNNTDRHTDSVVYMGSSGGEVLSADRNSLGMGDVCIAVSREFNSESKNAISNLTTMAKVHCPYYLSVSPQGLCSVVAESSDNAASQSIYSNSSGLPLFSYKLAESAHNHTNQKAAQQSFS